jgi:hypothetical protein
MNKLELNALFEKLQTNKRNKKYQTRLNNNRIILTK